MRGLYEVTFGLFYICFKVFISHFWEILAGFVLIYGGMWFITFLGGLK